MKAALDVDVDLEDSTEIRQLGAALADMRLSLKETAQAAKTVASGKMDVTVKIKGKRISWPFL